MTVSLAYGDVRLEVEIPEGVIVDSFDAARAPMNFGPVEFCERALAANLDAHLDGDSLLVVVNDAYRHTPTATVLTWLENLSPGVLNRAHFIIATGSHKPPNHEQLRSIFERHHDSVYSRVTSHDATDQSSMRCLGTDSFGAAVYGDQRLFEFEKVLVIGSVEPHFFAGFTGGRKSIFPGLMDLASIERNHNLANSLDAAPLKLKGNPVSEHLDALLDLLPIDNIVSIQLVADAHGGLAGAFIGDIRESFAQAVGLAEQIYSRKVKTRYDIALCELLSPLNKNLYQAQKALENCQLAVANGGAAIVISPCLEGIGSGYFFHLAETWDRQTNAPVDGVPRFGSHKLSRVNALSRRIDVCIHSELDDDVVRKVYFEPVRDVTAFVRDRTKGRSGARVAVVHDAGHTVLVT
ncbi:MAG: lactate racemase domain-containing protein [Candidatus Zixiibacteriota bacterium]